ncbi:MULTISPECIES: DsbA family protein [unclassified Aureimonas]|uniref:DsbA family protein n=1 Tax=unclassified Aureimonas TaxID=2615206 RepID=UPI0006F5A304|nr:MULTISPECIES: DsbA family protein [unclassified Aureimonas]KQT60416.1 hypothetical protein ASG62_07125 [Aureimonas sp. Leaf427]KQT79294.1 hypothetical protein ASG54_09725 [Aureimonas sp. Leaf460]
MTARPIHAALALALLGSTVLPAQAVTDAERGEIEGVVRDYLLRNPEVLLEALDALKIKQANQEAEEQKLAVSTADASLYASPEGSVLGNPKGDVTLVEFFDYNCGYCKRAAADLDGLIESDRNLRVVLKEIPVLGDESVAASHVSLAFRHVAPERYGEFQRKLLGLRGVANGDSAIEVAAELGVEEAQIRTAMAAPEVEAVIQENQALAAHLKVGGTPFYVIGKDTVPGAIGLEGLAAKVEEARRCNSAAC